MKKGPRELLILTLVERLADRGNVIYMGDVEKIVDKIIKEIGA